MQLVARRGDPLVRRGLTPDARMDRCSSSWPTIRRRVNRSRSPDPTIRCAHSRGRLRWANHGRRTTPTASRQSSTSSPRSGRHGTSTTPRPPAGSRCVDRGNVPTDGVWLELGSGTGAGARILGGTVGSLVATDLSAEMLHHVPPELAPRCPGRRLQRFPTATVRSTPS